MDDLNVLIDRAADESLQLAAEAHRGKESVTRVVARASALSDRITAEGQVVKSLMQTLATNLGKARQRIESEAAAARQEMAVVGERAELVKGEVAEALGALQASLDALEAARDEALAGVNAGSEQARGVLTALSEKIAEVEETAKSELEKARTAINTLRSNVNAARSALAKQKEGVVGQLKELERLIRERLDFVVQNFQAFAVQGERKMEDIRSAIDGMSEQLLQVITQQLNEKVLAKLEASVEPITSALEQLEQLAGEKQEAFEENFGVIAEKFEYVIKVVETIKPVINTIKTLVG